MTCRDFVEFLIDYLEGALAASEASRFDAHLRDCPECVEYLDGYRKALEAGKRVLGETEDEVPDDVPARLVAAILASRPKRT